VWVIKGRTSRVRLTFFTCIPTLTRLNFVSPLVRRVGLHNLLNLFWETVNVGTALSDGTTPPLRRFQTPSISAASTDIIMPRPSFIGHSPQSRPQTNPSYNLNSTLLSQIHPSQTSLREGIRRIVLSSTLLLISDFAANEPSN
jgi:hypothetical protein